MSPVVVVLAALTVVTALVDWWAVAPPGSGADERRRRAEAAAKPATLLLLTATAAAAGATGTTEGRWLLLALLLGLVGDVALLGRSDARFRLGLGAFLLGHLAYLAAFLAVGVTTTPWLVGGVAVLGVALVAGRRVVPAAHVSGGAALAAPVAVYMAVIGAMLLAGWATGDPWLAAGAAVFTASDTVLALDRFVRPRPWAHLTVMVTYHLGQALLVVGILVA